MLEELKKLSLVVRENEPLKNHTTFQIGGPAKIYLEVSEPAKLVECLKVIKAADMNYMLLGGGSNLVVSDAGFNGAVIKIKPRELKINDEQVKVDSGYSLAGLIMKTLDSSLTGLEFEAGVPGTVGGAIKGNAGTYGEAMDKIVKSIEYLDDDLNIKTIENNDCHFTYRHSIFKEHDTWLILSSILQLAKGDTKSSRDLIDQRIKYRMDSQPYGCPSAGCTFKNIIYTDEIAQQLKKLDWEISPKFKEYKKIPAAWVIENLGLKGKTIGKAQVSEKHANYIINLGGAKADEVIQLVSLIKQQVRDKVGIQLEEEIRYVGF
ncbi:MAG: UDP-N-acetylmuramate dehydrogenase [Candidatus Komeilibacteria bacterium]|nr:UDP-N-acetylmuramate dehydrogenase [Candidatus Komeilibacteria bacterium]